MVVVGVLITDADDAGPLRVQLARSYWPRLNSALDLYVGVLPREIIDHILNLFVHQGLARPRQARNSSVITGFAFDFNRLTK